MTEKMSEFLAKVRGVLALRKVQAVVLGGTAVTFLVSNVAAAGDTFNFTILNDLGAALVGLIPTANELVDQGAPLVIKIAVVACVCAPFIWLYHKSYGHK